MDYLMEDYYKELAAKNSVDKDVNKSNLAKKYMIPITTVWKQIWEIVKEKGHCSGGARKPRVLSEGKWNKTFSLDTLYMYANLSSEKLSTEKVVHQVKKCWIFFFTEDEEELEDVIIDFQKAGFPLTIKCVRQLAW